MKNSTINIKKIIRLSLILCLCIYSTPLKAQDTKTPVLKAQISESNLRDVFLKLVPDTLIDANLSIPGDFFSVIVTKPSAQLLQIPTGSRLIGTVRKIQKAKSFNRGGKFESEVKQVMLPDGSIIKAHAILSAEAGMQDMDKPTKTKKVLKAIKEKGTEIGAATLTGAMDSVQYFGLGTAISTYGISTAIGAGIGLGLGSIGALGEKGEQINYNEFDAINFKLESDFELLENLPLSASELEKLIHIEELGVHMEVSKIEKHFSRQFGDFLLVDMLVTNHSEEGIYLGDFVLRSNIHIRPVLANPLLANDSMKKLLPKESCHTKIAFSLGKYQAKEDYKVFLLNPLNQTIMANTDIQITDFI